MLTYRESYSLERSETKSNLRSEISYAVTEKAYWRRRENFYKSYPENRQRHHEINLLVQLSDNILKTIPGTVLNILT